MILINIKLMTSTEKRILQDLYNNAFTNFYTEINDTSNLYSTDEVVNIWDDYFNNKN